MNGWGFAAVAVGCVTVLVVALLWALVRTSQRQAADAADGSGMELVKLSADEEFRAVQEHNRAGREDLRRQIEAAAERARREREGGF